MYSVFILYHPLFIIKDPCCVLSAINLNKTGGDIKPVKLSINLLCTIILCPIFLIGCSLSDSEEPAADRDLKGYWELASFYDAGNSQATEIASGTVVLFFYNGKCGSKSEMLCRGDIYDKQ